MSLVRILSLPIVLPIILSHAMEQNNNLFLTKPNAKALEIMHHIEQQTDPYHLNDYYNEHRYIVENIPEVKKAYLIRAITLDLTTRPCRCNTTSQCQCCIEEALPFLF